MIVMEARSLPALICTAKCPRCDLPVQFTMFESGLVGDFATLIGLKTGALYRLDLGQVHHLNKEWEQLVLPAEGVEGGSEYAPPGSRSCLLRLLRARVCGGAFGSGRRIGGDSIPAMIKWPNKRLQPTLGNPRAAEAMRYRS
jgi:hypothetical protein